jgi:hypothetical protein
MRDGEEEVPRGSPAPDWNLPPDLRDQQRPGAWQWLLPLIGSSPTWGIGECSTHHGTLKFYGFGAIWRRQYWVQLGLVERCGLCRGLDHGQSVM